MRIRGCTVEYDLIEAAKMLGIFPDELKRDVEEGLLCYYWIGADGYRFHEASLLANRDLLSRRDPHLQRVLEK